MIHADRYTRFLHYALTYGSLSQREVARRSGVSQSYLSDLARGNRTAPESVRRNIADALGISERTLFAPLRDIIEVKQ